MNTSPYRIESFIAIPPKGDFRRRYPFNRLRIGGSFVVPRPPQEIEQTWNTLSSCARWATHKTGYRFTMRRVLEGIRVWRIA